jgi:hypothetical protein
MVAENKTRLRWMIALLAAVALAGAYHLRSPQPAGTINPRPEKKAATPKIAERETTLHLDAFAASQDSNSRIGQRNIFTMQAEKVELKNTLTNHSSEITPPVAEPHPSIPLKFWGYARKSDDHGWIFLEDNQERFVTRPGEIVERRYQVLEVTRNSVLIRDLLSGYQLRIPLSEK